MFEDNWKLSTNNDRKYTHLDGPENKPFLELLLEIQMLIRGDQYQKSDTMKGKLNKEVVQSVLLGKEVELIAQIMVGR